MMRNMSFRYPIINPRNTQITENVCSWISEEYMNRTSNWILDFRVVIRFNRNNNIWKLFTFFCLGNTRFNCMQAHGGFWKDVSVYWQLGYRHITIISFLTHTTKKLVRTPFLTYVMYISSNAMSKILRWVMYDDPYNGH